MPTETLDWSSESDWDNAQSESRVVHEAVSNSDHTDAGTVKQGYSLSNIYNASKLEAFYPMHDSGDPVLDFGPHGYDMANEGVADAANGLLNTSCLYFDGSSSLNGPQGIDSILSGSWTVCAWVNHDSTSGEQMWVQVGDGGQNGFDFHLDSGVITLAFSGVGTSSSNLSPSSGSWEFVATAYDAGNNSGRFRLNGSTESFSSSPPNDGSVDTHIGEDTFSGGKNMEGYMAGVWIFNDYLSSSEVAYLRNLPYATGEMTTGKKST